MIKSCPYCLSLVNLCPRCEGPVEVRKLVVTVHAESFSTSLILCTNLECQNYGIFKQQTAESVVTEICDACKLKKQSKELTSETIT